MDPMSLATVAGVLSMLKDLVALARENKAQEIEPHVIELHSAMLQLQAQISELLEENRALKAALDEKVRQSALEDDVEFEQDGHFYVRKSERGTNQVPYCPVCWGVDRKLVPLAPYRYPGAFRCAIHDSHYNTRAYAEWQAGQQPKLRSSTRGRFDIS